MNGFKEKQPRAFSSQKTLENRFAPATDAAA
jgi:hypothetical protein